MTGDFADPRINQLELPILDNENTDGGRVNQRFEDILGLFALADVLGGDDYLAEGFGRVHRGETQQHLDWPAVFAAPAGLDGASASFCYHLLILQPDPFILLAVFIERLPVFLADQFLAGVPGYPGEVFVDPGKGPPVKKPDADGSSLEDGL